MNTIIAFRAGGYRLAAGDQPIEFGPQLLTAFPLRGVSVDATFGAATVTAFGGTRTTPEFQLRSATNVEGESTMIGGLKTDWTVHPSLKLSGTLALTDTEPLGSMSAEWKLGIWSAMLETASTAERHGRVGAQTPVCSAVGFATTGGTKVCDGSANPVSVSATVRTYARLALDDVFGAPATALRFAMGDVDGACVSAPAAGVTCMADHSAGAATWYGDVRFRVKVSGIAGSRVKLIGARPSSGTIPAGRLLDGGAGVPPTSAYPVAPATGTELQTGIGNGETVVARSLGLRVLTTDPAGTWAGDTVFSLVLE